MAGDTAASLTPHSKTETISKFQWFALLPDDRLERVSFECWLEAELVEYFRNWKNRKCLPISANRAEEQGIFDDFLIDQAPILGPRLFCCDTVRRRMIYWQELLPDGPSRIRCFYAALKRHLDVARGKAKGSVKDPNEYLLRRDMLQELKALQHLLGTKKATRKRAITWIDVESEVKTHPDSYGKMFANLLSLKQFCNKNPEVFQSFAAGLETATKFVDEWLAWPKKLDPEYYRQTTSRLGNRRIRN